MNDTARNDSSPAHFYGAWAATGNGPLELHRLYRSRQGARDAIATLQATGSVSEVRIVRHRLTAEDV